MTIKGIKKLKSILDVCIAMGYGANQDYRKLLIGEVKHADVVIAFGKNSGLVMVRARWLANMAKMSWYRFMDAVERVADEGNRSNALNTYV